MPLLQEEAKKRMLAGMVPDPLVVAPEGVLPNKINNMRGNARDIAAKAAGVGGSIVQKALAVPHSAVASPNPWLGSHLGR